MPMHNAMFVYRETIVTGNSLEQLQFSNLFIPQILFLRASRKQTTVMKDDGYFVQKTEICFQCLLYI